MAFTALLTSLAATTPDHAVPTTDGWQRTITAGSEEATSTALSKIESNVAPGLAARHCLWRRWRPRRLHFDRMQVLRADLAPGLDPVWPVQKERSSGTTTIGLAFPAPKRCIAGERPTPRVVIETVEPCASLLAIPPRYRPAGPDLGDQCHWGTRDEVSASDPSKVEKFNSSWNGSGLGN